MVGVIGALFWVGGSACENVLGGRSKWGCMGHYFGWVGVGGKIFWVDGGGRENILGGWG